jgi:hypothetical protein
MSTLRAIYHAPSGKTLSLTDSDMLWAARGCTGESRGNASRELCAAFLWALMRRILLTGSTRTYGQMWLDFSQPINPIWLAEGAKCRPGGPYAGKKECSADKLAYRAQIRVTPWVNLPATIRTAVEDFAAGALPPPMFERNLPAGANRISNWASYAGIEDIYPEGYRFEGEWFLEDSNLADGDVTIKGVAEASSWWGKPVLGLGIGAGLFTVFRWWQKRRGK